MSSDEKLDQLFDILLDPKDGLSSRLLVVETDQTRHESLLTAFMLALNGDSNNKGLIELVRELREEAAKKAERRQFYWREWLWRGILAGGVLALIDLLIRRFAGA